MKNVEIPNFLSQTLASHAFRSPFLRPQAKNQNSTPNIFLALSSLLGKGKTQPPCPKTLGGDLAEIPLFGVWAGPRGPRGLNHPPKNYLQGV